ncbi:MULTISPECIES: hypothetical protein [unclassified Desulfovibrio]|uniref:hypothetical protein n=1 Tax=unclassified Desulfovibrio TaxID=2593640 RepID=UPI000F5EF3F3|nr:MULTISPECIES: hypothetical protein [unclassified Desulfovibrio]RRD70388.1 hypothetical protein EII24_06680 [Desulfovibrio sp. OH1209_COT-279]RRD86866.1 hypothetical protein EII23_06680 [Desulfovibrio sp. OH1186_COT-070]
MKHFKIFVLFAVLTVLPAACGPGNTVRLLPLPRLENTVLPAPNAPHVTVVAFEDKRLDQSNIGTRRDRSAFVTSDIPSQWVSKALADELSRNGLQVSYALGVAEARKGNPDYLVLGQLTEAELREISATELTSSLRVDFSLSNRQARIVRESLHASQSRTGLPSGSAADNLMQDTLQDLVKPVARKIIQAIEGKK